MLKHRDNWYVVFKFTGNEAMIILGLRCDQGRGGGVHSLQLCKALSCTSVLGTNALPMSDLHNQ